MSDPSSVCAGSLRGYGVTEAVCAANKVAIDCASAHAVATPLYIGSRHFDIMGETMFVDLANVTLPNFSIVSTSGSILVQPAALQGVVCLIPAPPWHTLRRY